MKKHIAIMAVTATLLLGCSKLTKENYDKLKAGLAYQEVEKILGSPTSCSEMLGAKSCIWGDEQKHIKVNFIADKAVLYSSRNIQ